jgi:hypothetical protein
MNKKEKKYLGIFFGAILLFVIVAQTGFLKQWNIPPFIPLQQTGDDDIPITPTDAANYANGIGKFQLDMKCFDSADPATTRAFGTILDAYWYHFSGGQWTPDSGAYDPAATNYFDAKAGDNGYAYVALEPHASAAYYVDYQKIMNIVNSYNVAYQYIDVDADGAKEFVFQYNLKSHSIPNSGYPILSFTAYALTYEAVPAIGHPTNLSSIGASTTTKYVEWYTSVTTVKKSYGLYKVEVKTNGTDETRVRLKTLLIPGLGNLDVSQFDKSFTASDIRWTYTMSSGFDGADYIVRMPNDANKFYMTAQLEFTMAAGSQDMTLTLYYLIGGTEAGASVSDAVGCVV